jgi:hypothetical protein
MKQLANRKHMENDCFPRTLKFEMMAKHGVPEPKFPNNAHVNWNAVRVTYDSGDAMIPIMDRKRTCLFRWIQSLEKHTKEDILVDLQDQHRQLYRQYKNEASPSKSETRYLSIQAWWLSSRATPE